MKKKFIGRHSMVITIDKKLWNKIIKKSDINQVSYNAMVNILLLNMLDNHSLSSNKDYNINKVSVDMRGSNLGKFHFSERYSIENAHLFHYSMNKDVWKRIIEFSSINKVTYNLAINFFLENALNKPVYLL